MNSSTTSQDSWRDDPSRRAVWHAVQSTPATRATAAATEQEMLDLIARVMKPLAPGSPDILRRELAGIRGHTVSSSTQLRRSR